MQIRKIVMLYNNRKIYFKLSSKMSNKSMEINQFKNLRYNQKLEKEKLFNLKFLSDMIRKR